MSHRASKPASARWIAFVAACACGCVDNQLSPTKQPPAGETNEPTADDSPVEATDDCTALIPFAGPSASSASATCSMVVNAVWDPFVVTAASDSQWALADPVVLPGGIVYVVQADASSLVALAPATVWEVDLPDVDHEDVAGTFAAVFPDTGAIGFGMALPASGSEAYAPYFFDATTGSAVQGDAQYSLTNEDVVVADVDADGILDVASPAGTLRLDGSWMASYLGEPYSMSSLYVDQINPEDAALEVVTKGGVWSDDDASRQNWGEELFWIGGVTAREDRPFAVYVTWPDVEGRWLDDGTLAWSASGVDYAYRLALGDVDGDGVDELCASFNGELRIMDLSGVTKQMYPHDDGRAIGSCSLADLDGDGTYEVVDWNQSGMFVFSGSSDEELFSVTDFVAGRRALATPAIADVDGDGSADIVVTGRDVGSSVTQANEIRVYGSATASWAPTTSVWSAPNFAAGTSSPDGRAQSRPLVPGWQRGMGFRAQPALAGLQDLLPRIDDVCVSCDTDSVTMSLRVENRGGTTATNVAVHLSIWTDGGWAELALSDFGDIAESTVSAGQLVTFPLPDVADVTVWVDSDQRDCAPDDDVLTAVIDGCP